VQCGNARLFLFPPFLSILLDQSVFMNPSTHIITKKRSNTLANKKKGDLFERYIATLFNYASGRFTLIEWRSDNEVAEGIYPQSNCYPDLEFCYNGNKKHRFAIECKWRTAFSDGKLKWADNHQIRNYLEFQREKGMPVFIALGVGGAPTTPAQLFVTPLDHISKYPIVEESQLIPFHRHPQRRFFFDVMQLRLF
jgi:hypothetical protein